MSFSNPIHVIRVGWRISDVVYPYLLYRNILDNKVSKKVDSLSLSQNIKLNLIKTNIQYCIGHESRHQKWIPCPNNNQISNQNNRQCDNCSKSEFFSCRITCHGRTCNPKTLEAKSLCDINETVLYLSYVGGLFKIGVTLNPIRRWIEQGSYYSIQLWKGHGLLARYYEQFLGTNLDLHLSVHRKTKIRQIGKDKFDVQLINTHFKSIIANIVKLKLFSLNYENTEIIDLTKHYGKIPILTRSPIQEFNQINGKIIGVQGRILVVLNRNTFYAIDLTKFVGAVLTPYVNEQVDLLRQRTLFDY